MRYNLYNNAASITVATNYGYYLILKSSIKSIRYVRLDIIMIDTGNPLGNIFLHQEDIGYPFTYSPQQLMNLLNDWISITAPE